MPSSERGVSKELEPEMSLLNSAAIVCHYISNGVIINYNVEGNNIRIILNLFHFVHH